jgi:hypothetical protein
MSTKEQACEEASGSGDRLEDVKGPDPDTTSKWDKTRSDCMCMVLPGQRRVALLGVARVCRSVSTFEADRRVSLGPEVASRAGALCAVGRIESSRADQNEEGRKAGSLQYRTEGLCPVSDGAWIRVVPKKYQDYKISRSNEARSSKVPEAAASICRCSNCRCEWLWCCCFFPDRLRVCGSGVFAVESSARGESESGPMIRKLRYLSCGGVGGWLRCGAVGFVGADGMG